MVEDLYKEVILDHYKNPRNKRGLPEATASRHKNNPLCGDEISIHLRLGDGGVRDITFEGQGCSISQASASMLTETVKGRSVGEAEDVAGEFRAMMEGEAEPDEDQLGDLVALKGVVKYPVRIKCAVLAWDVLQDTIRDASGSAGEAGPSA